ncbi:MAG: flagellar biosynthesis anti-sigma factor FlgM [Firmicutes bacterium]|jgi:anti-sigma28 factor (negative regulator of flagellin synthesis)|nr:flagellar biosynthesis anti-sigma factor FlgM [Bacillota bacterium]
MKIASNSLHTSYTIQKETARLQTSEKNQRRINRNFDKILIQSTPSSDSNDNFVSNITSKLSSEVRKPASSEQLNELRQKVAEGTYQIDLDAIVKKILF